MQGDLEVTQGTDSSNVSATSAENQRQGSSEGLASEVSPLTPAQSDPLGSDSIFSRIPSRKAPVCLPEVLGRDTGNWAV